MFLRELENKKRLIWLKEQTWKKWHVEYLEEVFLIH